ISTCPTTTVFPGWSNQGVPCKCPALPPRYAISHVLPMIGASMTGAKIPAVGIKMDVRSTMYGVGVAGAATTDCATVGDGSGCTCAGEDVGSPASGLLKKNQPIP